MGDPGSDRTMRAIEARRERVNDAIPEELPIEHPERLYEASRYLLDAGGKRLRPTVSLLVAEGLADVEPLSEPYRTFPALDGGEVDLMSAAVSLEIIHLFTLIHDDIMDDDELRRGVPAVHRAYDEETAILAGDTLYSKAFEVMLRTGAPSDRSVDLLSLLATTCTEICEGQALDIAFESRTDVSLEEYHEMIELKTAVLYGAAAAVPGILLGAPEGTTESLYRFGVDVGRAFQVQDDVLDLVAESETIGKRRGSDLIEGKGTVITMHAREQGVDVDSLVGSDPDGVTDAEIEAAVRTLREAGSIEYARHLARDLVASGKAELDVLPDNEPRAVLYDIADYLVEREY